jgi:ribose/xylose/arabinose/galactoside ABC-type transport system permease subunit
MLKLRREDPHVKPLALLAACLLLLTIIDWGNGRIWTRSTAFSALETFGTGGLVALGLGLTILISEFDLSVVGMFSMAGCIAVLTGAQSPMTGLALAALAGITAGVAQGFLITRLRLSSVGVTLGGLLAFTGVAFVLTESRMINYDNLPVALALTSRIGAVFSVRSLLAIAVFALVAAIFMTTRYGPQVIAVGSDPRAARIAGVDVDAIVIVIFAFSGFCAALSGALLSYSLASASPSGLSDVIPPAAAAAILGGVSLGGGVGRPLGIAIGVLSLAVLRAGMNAIGAPSYVNDIEMGAILLAVAIIDGPYLIRYVPASLRSLEPFSISRNRGIPKSGRS